MSYTSHFACLGAGAITTWVYTLQKYYIPVKEKQEGLEERIRLLEGAIVRLDKRDDHLWNLYNIRYRSDFTFHPNFTWKISEMDDTLQKDQKGQNAKQQADSKIIGGK